METRYLREVLSLHYLENLERTRMASSLGVSYTTVTRTLRKAEANGGNELLSLEDSELAALLYPVRPGPTTRAALRPVGVVAEGSDAFPKISALRMRAPAACSPCCRERPRPVR